MIFIFWGVGREWLTDFYCRPQFREMHCHWLSPYPCLCAVVYNIQNICLVCKLRVYCTNLITLKWYFSVNLLWWNQQSALLIMCAAYQKSNALCNTWMLFYYAFECCAITEFHAPCLPMNECLLLCSIAKIGRTTIAICADYPYLTGKRCI